MPGGLSSCLPCELEHSADTAVVYRDERWSCEVSVGYDVPGWFILRSRRHAEGWSGLTPEELAEFGPLAQRVASAVEIATGAPKVYFMSFGENYPHFHFLIAARGHDIDSEFRSGRLLELRTDHRDLDSALVVASAVRARLMGASGDHERALTPDSER